MSSLNNPIAQKYPINVSSIENTPGVDPMALQVLQRELRGLGGFSSAVSFNSWCRGAISAWERAFPERLGATEMWSEVISRIDNGERDRAGLEPIKTPWGGVSVVIHAPPHIEKYLAIKSGGYLAFETHERKEEQLRVMEGAGLLIYRAERDAPLQLKVLVPGVEASFAPGQEHCIVGTEDLLIYETSADHKGMDKDLIFIFMPE